METETVERCPPLSAAERQQIWGSIEAAVQNPSGKKSPARPNPIVPPEETLPEIPLQEFSIGTMILVAFVAGGLLAFIVLCVMYVR